MTFVILQLTMLLNLSIKLISNHFEQRCAWFYVRQAW